MASTRREKELARMRAERQAARRAEEAAKRKRRSAIIASALAVLLVAGAVAFIGVRSRDNGSQVVAGGTAPTTPAASGPCTYDPAGEPSKPVEPPPATPTATGPVKVTSTTNRGVVVWDLLTEEAPCTSNSIISLASQGFYDDTPCHRLTTSGIFVLQCGDPTGEGTGGPGYQFAEENLEGATYPRGTVAMAKSSAPGSTGSQFFLVYKDTELPPEYTPVGKITKGLDVLDEIADAGSEPKGDGKPKLETTIETFTTDAT